MAMVIVNVPDVVAAYAKDSQNYITMRKTEIAWKALADGIVLPDNCTNGDVIKALFSDCVLDDDFGDAVITNVDNVQYYSKEWWNSPYKEAIDGNK